MDFLTLMQTRYTTKHYDPNRPLAPAILDKILECVRLTPSAVNIQSTRVLVLSTREGKARLRPAVPDFNRGRYDDCAAVLVLCARPRIAAEDAAAVARQELADGRLTGEAEVDEAAAAKAGYAGWRFKNVESCETWTGKQAYLCLATALYAAAAYGVDSTPIEGVDLTAVDKIFGLRDRNLCAQALVLLGYRSPEDGNVPARRPKSRLSADVICERY